METPTELSLFSGTGGGLLATQHLLKWRTVCYVEWDKYAVEVLKARIRDGYIHDAPIWDDAFTFDGRPWTGLVDIVSAGFPCQPFSTAGKGLAEYDPRNGWPSTIRIIREVRPRIAWLENVPGLLAKPYFGTILGELAEEGYRVRWDCVSAQEVGAPHLRERLWIVAYAEHNEQTGQHSSIERQKAFDPDRNGKARNVADTTIERLERAESARTVRTDGRIAERGGSSWQWWTTEPDVGRVANGVASRVDRLRATGNGQVPGVVAEAWRRLTQD